MDVWALPSLVLFLSSRTGRQCNMHLQNLYGIGYLESATVPLLDRMKVLTFVIKCRSRSARFQQFVNYISDLETRGTASIVPEFPSKLDWLNTAPLKLNRFLFLTISIFEQDLKGKVVPPDFWTYCCINCMHVLPDLEFLEKKYKDMPFTVVGVHFAKFDNEKDLEAIRNAILQYGITHPVTGQFVHKGQPPKDRSKPSKMVQQMRPVTKQLLEHLIFRSKGLAYDAKKNLLYGVDTKNRALRVINFVDEMAGTLVGNGTKGSDDKGGGRGTTQARIHSGRLGLSDLLNSPGDVCFDPVNKIVYIAMAGQHQIWEHNTLDVLQ
ncbi:hypothetical protein RHGRI_029813 [Rhododendron griersonianum]|uniref:Thioredoxin domain-containing protein n=1 Tax=Rhododendron griersonianum TaxID=479676 RepID=A0AAV6IPC7_9ERIC|nr:hypothetical protein RHGRI_029813 [Rhododendron griersonianum]